MRFPRLPLVRNLFGRDDLSASKAARRWAKAYSHEPKLAEDVLELGGVLMMPSALAPPGLQETIGGPVDPHRLAFEAGQRDLAVKLTALMGMTHYDLSQLMEASHED